MTIYDQMQHLLWRTVNQRKRFALLSVKTLYSATVSDGSSSFATDNSFLEESEKSEIDFNELEGEQSE